MSKKHSKFDEIVESARQQGFGVKRTRSGWRIMAPDGKGLAHLHLTPSDHRNIKNTTADMRRIGLKI
jgi:hypothetical protein